MPRLVLMTWKANSHRWTKMYKGRRFYVSTRELGTPPTQADSLEAANEWWRGKQAEIDGYSRHPAPGSPKAIQALLEAWAGGSLETPEDAAAALVEMKTYFKSNPMPPEVAATLLGPERVGQFEAGGPALLDGPATPPEKTVGRLVATWVATERQRMAGGKVGHSRMDMNRVCLHHFRDWLGEHAPVECMNESKWLDWYNHLAGQVAAGTWAASHAHRIFAVSRRFVKFLWEMRLVELPRNLDSKALSFRLPPPDIEIFTADELRQLNAVVKGQSRLHFLLMLNAGCTAKDVSDLHPAEVDWKAGTLNRKRSKTRQHKDVPTVCYKLWEETFALLREHRSDNPEVVLLSPNGQRWVEDKPHDGVYARSDKVAAALRYYMKKAGVEHAPKALRATAASKLAEHPQFKFYADYFLGHSAREVGEKHYIKPNEKEFFKALAWLEKAFGLTQ